MDCTYRFGYDFGVEGFARIVPQEKSTVFVVLSFILVLQPRRIIAFVS